MGIEDNCQDDEDEPWKRSVSYPSEEDIRKSLIKEGSYAEQELRLDEIDDLVNDKKYGRAKCLLDEMLPSHDVNEAEHSFQLARCYMGLCNKKNWLSHLEKAIEESKKAVRLAPDNERYKKNHKLIMDDYKKIRRKRKIMRHISTLVIVAGLGVLGGMLYNSFRSKLEYRAETNYSSEEKKTEEIVK